MVKIFVGNLDDDCTNEELYSLFAEFGNITDCEKLTDKPFGFVHMEKVEDADAAAKKLHRLEHKGKRLRVELSHSKPTKVFIGNVPHECTSEDLKEIFLETGLDVNECDKVENKGFGFAHVSSSKGFKEINRVVRSLDKTLLKGRHLNIEISENAGEAGGRGPRRDRGAPYAVGKRGVNTGGVGYYDDYYPMDGHMNKMRGYGMGMGAMYQGGMVGAIGASVSQWANEAQSRKIETENKMAMKHAGLFHHLSAPLSSLMESGKFSDYKLHCETKIFDVHKAIVASQSPRFVELIIQNSTACQITDMDAETLVLLTKFMYSGIVDVSDINPTKIIKLLSAAEKYQVEHVKDGLEAALMSALDVNNVVDFLIISEELELIDLKFVAMRFIGTRSAEMRQRDDFRAKLTDYPNLMMQLYDTVASQ